MIKKLLIIIFSLLAINTAFATTQWRTLKHGLQYTELKPNDKISWSKIHAFKIDLKKYRLHLAFAKEHNTNAISVRQMAKDSNALLAINGGFFTPELKPIGLRIKDGKIHSPLKHTSWWGVFYTRGQHAYIVAQQQYRPSSKIDFAVQGGPRLIANGRITNLKPGTAERSALCINRRGQVLIISTDSAAMTTTELAKILVKPESRNGLSCINALNLDGGHSTQLYARVGQFNLDVPGFSAVTDAVLVVPR